MRSNEPIPEPMALATGSDSRPVSSAAPEASAYGSAKPPREPMALATGSDSRPVSSAAPEASAYGSAKPPREPMALATGSDSRPVSSAAPEASAYGSAKPTSEPMALATGSDSRPVSSAAPEASAYGSMNSASAHAIDTEEGLMRALLAGYPDRLAKRRSPGKSSALMVGGRAVQLGPTSGVLDPDLFLCIDVDGGSTDAVVRQASGVQRDWLDPSLIEERVDLFFHPTQQQVVARRRTLWSDLVLEETPVAIPSEKREAASQLLFEQALKSWSTIFPSDDDKMLRSLVERCRWLKSVAPELDLPDLSQAAMESVCRELCRQYQSLTELKKAPWIDWIMNSISREQMITLNREAPERITVPSGSSILIEYRQDQPPILAVRIQELFSWKATPRLAMGRVPVLLHLLAPNMRPQQVTEDLASFWSSGYAIVKKELKRRYPKHAWPDDPTTATPTARTTRNS